jgi:hypothetical protein
MLAVVPALAAQDKPTHAAIAALAGSWTLDAARSDTIPANPLSMAASGMAFPAAASGGGGGGGGGGKGKGKGGGGGATAPTDPSSTAAPAPRGGGDRTPGMQYVVAEMRAVPTLTITANDTSVTIAAPGTDPVLWRADGKKRQQALMEGGMLELQAQWSDAEFDTMRGVPSSHSLKREFTVSKDGKTLQIKETLDLGHNKVEKKLIYTRNP